MCGIVNLKLSLSNLRFDIPLSEWAMIGMAIRQLPMRRAEVARPTMLPLFFLTGETAPTRRKCEYNRPHSGSPFTLHSYLPLTVRPSYTRCAVPSPQWTDHV